MWSVCFSPLDYICTLPRPFLGHERRDTIRANKTSAVVEPEFLLVLCVLVQRHVIIRSSKTCLAVRFPSCPFPTTTSVHCQFSYFHDTTLSSAETGWQDQVG